ncbi:DNA methyltransferase [Aeribacillus alveayuensis]|uniref:DNA modification methylase/DNA-directed RNA polymerase subunit RPC12/RpoP n=1 Tax=Aeribacillus alveayuensis TaxID=279215 RepID=A0ABT9VQR8_9BACI|nr:DNA modification methylase/DNA-directed RNA polymerase subunit RPC12/RpoP [Bacillus alveayuensis]
MDEKQLSLLDDDQADNGTVVCLGMTFKNDEERREYFRNELRKKLPELKKIEGFPIGDDEDIIALSDPPYYTACPNPWINDFIEEWEREKKEKYGRDENEEYHREPFAADVSEGKNDPIYNAHSYHTKVPHRAIMRYILHYTKPGDIVFDGFGGTGMTGVAANLCNDPKEIQKLGYTVDQELNIFDEDSNIISKLGVRNCILNDLSPTATLISNSYLSNLEDKRAFLDEANMIIEEIEQECGWMFETKVEQNDSKIGRVNYTVWSDLFICNNCTKELIYWDISVDEQEKKLKDEMYCRHCGVKVNKRELERVYESYYDPKLGKVIREPKQVPVLINYTYGKQRFDKKPDEFDFELFMRIKEMKISTWYPTNGLKNGDKTVEPRRIGLEYVHQFYSKRNLAVISLFLAKVKNSKYKNLFLNILRSSMTYSNRMVKVNIPRLLSKGGIYSFGFVNGTYYIPSINGERSMIDALKSKIESTAKTLFEKPTRYCITNQSITNISLLKNDSIDYIFIDPPFGSNLMYSELNYLWESWLRVFTDEAPEAIVNKSQEKIIDNYRLLMLDSFKECYRVLKPGRWITVEFSNSQASVWNSIREALERAGFIIADVSSLDKKQGTFNAITTTTAVKQDLVISAYKPKQENIEKMRREQNTEESAWTFVRQHLEQLPVFVGHKGEAQIITERTPRILFDRMVAYHVQNGLPVPISSADFQEKVAQRFPMRDGMVFLESQVAEYDKKRLLVKEFVQMNLFVSDENSAIEWLRQQLLKKPQTRQDIHPNFMKEIQHIAKHEKLPELDDLLHQNFLKYEGDGPVPDQIASYLRRNYKDLRGLESDDPQLKEKAMNRWYVPDPNKQADLEKLREKALLREFEGYLEELEKSKKKLKQFRTEAIRAGFKKAWSEKDYEKIVKVGDRLPEKVIQEDDKLLMYYDNAQIRLGL